MVGKKEIKFIKSLRNKKFRINNNCFVVEGKKSVNEFLKSDYKLVKLYTVSKTIINIDKQEVIDKNLLEKISFFNMRFIKGFRQPSFWIFIILIFISLNIGF